MEPDSGEVQLPQVLQYVPYLRTNTLRLLLRYLQKCQTGSLLDMQMRLQRSSLVCIPVRSYGSHRNPDIHRRSHYMVRNDIRFRINSPVNHVSGVRHVQGSGP